jgi:hypothetical protein
MALTAFHDRFPQSGANECRVVVLPEGGEQIPPGSYAFVEFYCDECECDCRRVVLTVTDEQSGQALASISFGFDAEDPDRGPLLHPLNRPCCFAEELLSLTKEVVLSDKAYVARLEQHYRMFKADLRGESVAGPDALTPREVQGRIAQRKAARQRLNCKCGRKRKQKHREPR